MGILTLFLSQEEIIQCFTIKDDVSNWSSTNNLFQIEENILF